MSLITAEPRTGRVALFPVDLGLPTGSNQLHKDAAQAIKKEYRSSVKWKNLRCRSVRPLSDAEGEAIFVLEVGQSIEFDWTWEGSVAFRPLRIDDFRGDVDLTAYLGNNMEEHVQGHNMIWAGEVVEVDETNGRIFVWVNNPENPPKTGAFYVRPFEFLAFLHDIYCQSNFSGIQRLLPERLQACVGGIHPRSPQECQASLPELKELWRHTWGCLWGPPGCGKTTTIGQQVAQSINDPAERILVVSTSTVQDSAKCSEFMS